MTRKSFLFGLMATAVAMMLSVQLTSCGSDDDNKQDPQNQTNNNGNNQNNNNGNGQNSNGQPSSLQSLLVGNVWYWVEESSSTIEIEAIQFNADGTGRSGELKRRASDGFSETVGEEWNISYTINGDILTVTELVPGESDVNTWKCTPNSDGTVTIERVRNGNVGSTKTCYRLVTDKTPEEGLEELMVRLAAKYQ